MEEERAESYRALYRVRPLLYRIGDIRLWVPIRQDGIVLWFVYVGLFFFFCYIVPILSWILPIDRMIIIGIGPLLAAYYSVKLDPVGKTVPKYLNDLLRFHLRPKWLVKWQVRRFSIVKHKIHFQGSCRSFLRRKTESNKEEWRGRSGWLQGTVQTLLSCHFPTMQKVKWQGRGSRLCIVPASVTSVFLPVPSTIVVKQKKSFLFCINESVDLHILEQHEGSEWQFTPSITEEKGGEMHGTMEASCKNQRSNRK